MNQQLNTTVLTINKRLTELMKRKGMSMTELSQKAKIAIGTVQKLMTDPNCNPTLGSLEAICKVLNVSISELIGDEPNVKNLFGKPVPILEWSEISNNSSFIEKALLDKNISSMEFVKTLTSVSEQSFGLKVQDNTFLPIFKQNSILIFDTHKALYHQCYVLVKLHNHDTIVFKQLIIDSPYQYLKSVNPLITDNLIKLEIQDKIIATLIEAKINY